jgi:hypothetical protein
MCKKEERKEKKKKERKKEKEKGKKKGIDPSSSSPSSLLPLPRHLPFQILKFCLFCFFVFVFVFVER